MSMRPASLALLAVLAPGCGPLAPTPEAADIVFLGGKFLTLDGDRIVEALAVKGERIAALGTDDEIRRHIGEGTRIRRLKGRHVLPGLIETHCHPLGVARSEAHQPWAQLDSIPEIQEWIRKKAQTTPEGKWIYVPRTDITRLPERRHPTPEELDAGSTKHPVLFVAARKHVFNTVGFRRVGVDATNPRDVPGLRVERNAAGVPQLLAGAQAYLQDMMPRPVVPDERVEPKLLQVLRAYNQAGITSMFDRATDRAGYELWAKLRDEGQLTIRTTVTFRSQFRDGGAVEAYVRELGLGPGDADPWLKPGPLKIVVDGGIHWGTTHLREAYGPERAAFYRLDDPSYRGTMNFTVDRMAEIFEAGDRLGWQMSCHVTGDAGMDRVLDALDRVRRTRPIHTRRFTIIHGYFPDRRIARRCRDLGIVVDTQPYLYYRDSEAMAEKYGLEWAARFIGVGEWRRSGVTFAINSDHMIGMDPDRSMNSFNPFLQMYVAVTRKNEKGKVYGKYQKLSRRDALRAMTIDAAYLSFDEGTRGTLEPGKLADFAVIDRDYLTCPEEQIREIQVLETVVGGKTVFARPEE